MWREYYQDKANRDAQAVSLARQGYRVTTSAVDDEFMHPAYVEDYYGIIAGSRDVWFKVLYVVVAERI